MDTMTTATMSFPVTKSPAPTPPASRDAILANPGFGTNFTDHMAVATWTPVGGWHDDQIKPYGPFQLDPASAVLHYAQEIFEGLKAYRHPDGSVWSFRPEANAERLIKSAERMALPALPVDDFIQSLRSLVATDEAWVPSLPESSLYLRPFMFASEAFLGVRPAHHITYSVIASPVGAYFASGPAPVTIWLSRAYSRAAHGGTGAAKTGGNYAASLRAQQEATAHGCAQVCFLDAREGRWIEELGGMNLFFVHADGTIVTPSLSGTILPGITRSSVMTLAEEDGLTVEERQFSIEEWTEGVASGAITEVFACGTAAVITPLGRLRDGDDELVIGDGETAGPVTLGLREHLVAIQTGMAEDTRGWMTQLA